MTFQPLFPLWAIIPGFLLLLTGLSWLELRRPGRWRRARLIALVLALLAIAGLVLQPSREKSQKEAAILLLTSGFDHRIVDSLQDVHPDWQLIRTPDAPSFPKSGTLTDFVELSTVGRRIGAIVGDGFPSSALEYFTEGHFQYFPSPMAEGISHLTNKEYHEGQVNQVEGAYYPRDTSVLLLLMGPAGVEDSVLIEQPGQQSFSLSFTPKSSGLWQYRLLEKDRLGQVIADELLPIVVAPEKQLRVLIWQAYPTFEARSLKGFLADRGHAVAVRSQLSRDKYRREFANLSSRELNRLDETLLEDFDLLILDGSAYDLLTRNERSSVAAEVEKGLGFLGLVAGESPAMQRWLELAAVAPNADTIRLANGLALSASAVRTNDDREWYDIHRSVDNQPVAAYFYHGRGKIGFQSAREIYSFLLEGDSLTYAAFWMPILEGVLREYYPAYTIDLPDGFPVFAGEPLDFRVIAIKPIEEVYADSLPVPMLEDYALDEVWYGRTWPAREGWHEIRVGDQVLPYYAFSRDRWETLAAAQKKRHTALHAQPDPSLDTTIDGAKIRQPISRLWFYCLFLVCAGFLWLAPRL